MLAANKLNIYLKKNNRQIIKDFTFSLNRGDKAVVIGEEGNGKSTLLRFLCDERLTSDYAFSVGSVARSGKFGYLPQFMPEAEQALTVGEYLSGVDVYGNYDVAGILLSGGLPNEERPISTLSGGEKVRLQLLKLLCDMPDALFLDEPSNDLDIDALAFLEEFIAECKVPIMFISHDETLIERTANVIIHIEQLIVKTQCRISVARMGYADYIRAHDLEFERKTQIALKERADYKKKTERLQQLYEKARHNTGWKNPNGIASSDGHAKRSMQSIVARKARYEREKESFSEIPDKEQCIIAGFDERVCVPSQKRVLELSMPELTAGGKTLAKNIELTVIGNAHVCIIGSNGAGKSTLLKEIWRRLMPRTDIVVGYMPQDYADVLDFSITPAQNLSADFDKEQYTRAMTLLGRMKFTRDEMASPVGELSGGQKAKLIFLTMVVKKANVLILDEPTRNFSPLSAPVIRDALARFNGTIISVSHDRKYLAETADTIFTLTPDGLKLL